MWQYSWSFVGQDFLAFMPCYWATIHFVKLYYYRQGQLHPMSLFVCANRHLIRVEASMMFLIRCFAQVAVESSPIMMRNQSYPRNSIPTKKPKTYIINHNSPLFLKNPPQWIWHSSSKRQLWAVAHLCGGWFIFMNHSVTQHTPANTFTQLLCLQVFFYFLYSGIIFCYLFI